VNATHFGFGEERPRFWISYRKKDQSLVHVAFSEKDSNAVEEFYLAAFAAGKKTSAR
jgi:hypothetical protein